ncbi:hypothetical protein SERLA73DRAFT_186798 [Serpula lacrymans var. lacrymans S7.3]|uniref:Indoleamine 2,3-dioxygenase n=3 Tax=Serpula lacrymans TaxID=85982 RepID=F8Q7W5_SERL3|nr:uncharacterized protein SERLADRAFT_476036 [Serpula lacrymans var. lacrymans S7.9]EGN95653.1 hypothetical protein SERLA73DRAFT_186798 [Serpula lacrymans var. lacrymans S7.3]EGO21180.1 hypothetical protein SERLADRAFT_476036 [Serpula lacrymans var. lacrymans S7.9]
MDKQLLRRAHKVLAFLVHFYVHSIPPAKSSGPTIVPRSLAIPLVEVSKVLGMAPVLTYLDTVVWNWEVIDPTLPVTIDNMRWVDLFSGTEDERNFFFAAARTEMRGIEIIQIINDYLSLPDVNDINAVSKVSKNLNRLTVAIREIDEMVQEVREMVDPRTFYWTVRPWFNGSPSEEEGGEWIFEGVPNTRSFDLSGPSNGQSSMIHALDIFLAVDHKLQQRRYPAPSESNKRADHGFMDRMRRYMPGRHREYLSRLEANPRPLRELVQNTPVLREPYNAAVAALKKLRDRHMRVACLYVVTMSRSTATGSKCPVLAMAARMEREGARKGPAKGTGGNDLSLLLKAGRDATQRTMLKSN